jgi:signal peptidase I
MSRATRAWWLRWAASLVALVVLLGLVRMAVVDWLRVPSGSMEPTLRVGDRLLVNHLAYGPRVPFTRLAIKLGAPRRGDVVVFRAQSGASQLQVKRIVGLGGDRVDFRDGVAGVNGQAPRVQDLGWGGQDDLGHRVLRLAHGERRYDIKLNPFILGRLPMAIAPPDCRVERPGAWVCTVPPGRLLVLGDNRDDADDSRAWGFLPEDALYGRVDRVLFNPSDATRRWLPL